MTFVLWIALVFCLLGVVALIWGRDMRTRTGIPRGEVVYSDVSNWQKPEKPLLSRRYGLVGRPDYLVRVKEGREIITVPVEVKSRARPPEPYDSHVLQLATYCLLVEDVLKERPPYGLLRYADVTLRIPYTDDLRQQVLDAADAIRAARRATAVGRQHDDANRCRVCGHRTACGEESLVRPS